MSHAGAMIEQSRDLGLPEIDGPETDEPEFDGA
jgi:hypothetical protein